MTKNEIIFLLSIVGLIVLCFYMYPTSSDDKSNGKDIEWASLEDSPSEQLTISWMGCPGWPTAQKETWAETLLEKRFNIELKPTFLSWNALLNRKPLMLSGGDIPDVCWDGDPANVRRFIRQGFVMEIPREVILKHAPTYVKHLNQFGPEAWAYASYQGRNYGIPTFAASDRFPPVSVWRKDWLRNVGIKKVPDTVDEMYEALYKFRHNDPDGNGVKDTYGMCPRTHGTLLFMDVFAAHNILAFDFVMRDGKAVWGGIQPEAKEVLKILKKWYKEGLVDSDFVTGNLVKKKFLSGKTGYMYGVWGGKAALDLESPNSIASQLKALFKSSETAPAKPPLGMDGKRRRFVYGGAAHIIWFGKQVKDDPVKVIRVLRMFEEVAKDRELFIQSRLGERGKHWDWSAERGVFPLPPFDKRGEDKKNLIGAGAPEGAYGFFTPSSVPLSYTNHLLADGVQEFRKKYRKQSWGFRSVIGKPDVVESAPRYLQDLMKFQTTAYLEIIMGDKPLDYFDEFVEEWKGRGGDILNKEANEMLITMQELFKSVGVESGVEQP